MTNEELQVHAIYMYQGVRHIATTSNTLIDMRNGVQVSSPEEALLHYEAGDPAWILDMVGSLSDLARQRSQMKQALSTKTRYIEQLGQALLEKAEEKEWCEEYNEFAREWNLPLRKREWEVTVRMRILVSTEEDALEYAENQVKTVYSDGYLVDTLEYEVCEA